MESPSLRLALALAALMLATGCSGDARPPVLNDNDVAEDLSDANDAPNAADAPNDTAQDTRPNDVSDGAVDAPQTDAATPDASDASDAKSLDADDASDVADASDATEADATDASAPDVTPDVATDVAPDVSPDVPAPDVVTCAGAMCGAMCVDTQRDAHHCGACGNDCAALPGVRADAVTCVAGVCTLVGACATGRAHCTSRVEDGCETDLTSLDHCGACETVCPARVNASAVCAAAGCSFTCAANFGDCNAAATDGCETDTRVTLAHCGTCGNACPARANATIGCAAGGCTFTCATNFGDCNAVPADGCETDTRVTPTHCGMCGRACPAVANGRSGCAAGACTVTCDPGYVLAGTRCDAVAPRPVHPMSTATVSTLRPTLTFVPSPGSDGTRVQICSDRACGRVDATIDVTTSATARPTTVLAPGVHFWRLTGLRSGAPIGGTSAPWEFLVGRRDTPTDTSWGTMPDVNGDGIADAVVGSQGAEVRVFHGGLSGLTNTPAAVLHPTDAESTFGFALSSAGDVNGDGYADVIVGSRGSGEAYVYHGSATGISVTPTTVLVGSAATSFGAGVTSLGDFDHDGYGDVAVGAPGLPMAAIPGAVYVYRGSATGIVATTRTTHLPGEGVLVFGFVLSSAGDINGDGFEDMLVGAPGYLMGTTGNIYVYYGSAAGMPATPSVRYVGTPNTYYGFPVAQLGDVNGDGYSDISTGLTFAGMVHIYHGGAAGPSPTPSRVLTNMFRADFGRYISSGGDLNADGFSDVLIGADYFSQVHVFYGSTGGIPATADAFLNGASESNFGRCVTSPGDTNGDGFPDVLVGAPTLGTVNVYLSNGSRGLVTTPFVSLTSTAADFGYALAGL